MFLAMFCPPRVVDTHDFLLDDFVGDGANTDEQKPENHHEE
jgi:hypothetical protein